MCVWDSYNRFLTSVCNIPRLGWSAMTAMSCLMAVSVWSSSVRTPSNGVERYQSADVSPVTGVTHLQFAIMFRLYNFHQGFNWFWYGRCTPTQHLPPTSPPLQLSSALPSLPLPTVNTLGQITSVALPNSLSVRNAIIMRNVRFWMRTK